MRGVPRSHVVPTDGAGCEVEHDAHGVRLRQIGAISVSGEENDHCRERGALVPLTNGWLREMPNA
jgi:hypothetical protein